MRKGLLAIAFAWLFLGVPPGIAGAAPGGSRSARIGLLALAGSVIGLGACLLFKMAALRGTPRLVIDETGIHDFDWWPRGPLVIPWEAIDFICPTPFSGGVPEPMHLSLHIRLRDPSSFWGAAGRQRWLGARSHGSHDIDLLPLSTLPLPLDDLYDVLRRRSRFELLLFDWPDSSGPQDDD
jgi:hypothetical protein